MLKILNASLLCLAKADLFLVGTEYAPPKRDDP
jgi:hypothetical protein